MIVNNGKVIDLDSDVETIEARVQKEQEVKKAKNQSPAIMLLRPKNRESQNSWQKPGRKNRRRRHLSV